MGRGVDRDRSNAEGAHVTSPAPSTARTGVRRLVPLALTAALAVLLATGGAAVWLTSTGHLQASKAVAEEPAPDPVLLADAPAGPRAAVDWAAPLTLAVTDGTLRTVTVLDPDGRPLPGTITDPTTWRSTAATLIPAATYTASAAAADRHGAARTLTLFVHTSPAARVLHATLSPGDDDVVGVGAPAVVLLDHPVKSAADRAAVEQRLSVRSVPAVQGAWRWMDSTELHYRPATFWPAGTRITLGANFYRLQLSDGTWGSGIHTTSYRIGDAMISVVDVRTHTMTVRRNGTLLRVLKVSTGRPEFETHNGVHIVLEKVKLKTMDSSTIGIPRNSPGGYYLQVPNSVRISNSGEFVHSAPGTVKQQGHANVSHGCVNLSPADAAWFFPLAKRGDVVQVVGSPRKPISWDPGTSDWNVPFSRWAS
jgi:lipoprotein-anchoring transpeptidase ErfK/SrfK